jgi:hypothetical protein
MPRFLISVVIGGCLIGLRYWNEIDSVHWLAQLSFIALVAFAVGFFAGRLGWLAALAASVIGHALWVGIELRPSLPWAATDVWDWAQWQIFLVTLLPTAFGAAVLGGIGEWAARIVSRKRLVDARTGVGDGQAL